MHVFSFEDKPIKYSQEIIGGAINFMTIAYIIVVNPAIMNADGSGLPIIPSITATILTIIVMTTLAGFLIKLPFALAPGMGTNALVSYTIILHDKIPPQIALGVIFWSGCIMFLLSVTNLRQRVINAIPVPIQLALSVGIGLFLILLGLKNIGFIISNPNTILSTAAANVSILLCFFGFISTVILFLHGKAYAFILPIIIITIFCILNGSTKIPSHWTQPPDFSLFLHADLIHSIKLSILPAIISLFIVNFFDSTSTAIGLLSQLHLKENRHKYLKLSLTTDGIGGMISSLLGTSTAVIFVESSSGIQNGAKTGFASIVTALICIPMLFISPIISIIPASATSPILIFVGMLMMNNFRKIKTDHLEDFIAVILTIVMMPFCFSITAGAVFGIISYTLLKLLLGKFNELNPTLIGVAICCNIWFVIR